MKPHFQFLCKFCILLVLVCYVESLFRFCYQGTWHELKENDCPYGLLFNEKIRTPCFYSQGKDNTTARIWPSICDDVPYINDKDETQATIGDGFVLAQKNGDMQLIQYGIKDSPDKLPIWDDVVDLATCEDLCYLNIKRDNVPESRTSHEEGDSIEDLSMHREDINETQKMALTDQTLRLGDYLFDELNTEEQNRRAADEGGPELRIVQLYKKVIKILSRTCPDPFIPEDFRNRILSGFLFLVQDTGIGEVDDVSAEAFEEIMSALRSCENMNPTFRLEGTVCSMKTIASDVIKILPDGDELEAQYRPVEWEKSKTAFPYLNYDPFTEFAWQAVTVIHGSCFATFKPNANMHHKFTSAMERLFGDKIRFRWENPTQLEDNRMWGTWFLADLDTTHMYKFRNLYGISFICRILYRNFGACIAGAYEGAPFAMKLDRPIDKLKKILTPTNKRRRRRQATGVPQTTPLIPTRRHSTDSTTQATPMEADEEFDVNSGSSNTSDSADTANTSDQDTKARGDTTATYQDTKARGDTTATATTATNLEDGDIQAYWKYYRAGGGIQEKLKGDVQCFQTLEKRDLIVQELKDAVCSAGSAPITPAPSDTSSSKNDTETKDGGAFSK